MVPSKIPWWVKYRQNRKTMSAEMIVRTSFLETFKAYARNCSISGIQQMFEPEIGWLQRMVRTCIFCSLTCLLWYLLYCIWSNILVNPLIVSTESATYPIEEIDFPAVALCNINRISKKAPRIYSNNTISLRPELRNASLEDVENFFLQAGRLLDFSFEDMFSPTTKAFYEMLYKEKYNKTKIVESMKKLAPSCEEMLLRCSWAGEVVPCASLFAVRRTGRGHCCVFNYILDYDSATSPNATIAAAKRQYLPGFMQGLNVMLDPLLEDYAYPLSNFRGFDVLLYNPTHFADLSAGRLAHRIAEPDHAEFLQLKSIKQVASPEVRKYPLKIRKCLFKDELKHEFNQMYSYSACIVRCRIKTIQSLCKCTPYFLPAGKTEGPICTMEDLLCLNKYKEKLLFLYPINPENTEGLELEMEESLYCPECLPDCELTQHFTKSYKMPIWLITQKAYFVYNFMDNINITNKIFLSVYHPVSDGQFDRLDVVSYWFELLSIVGGYCGVILGLSVFSVVEIVYFLLVRFVIVLRYNYLKYH